MFLQYSYTWSTAQIYLRIFKNIKKFSNSDKIITTKNVVHIIYLLMKTIRFYETRVMNSIYGIVLAFKLISLSNFIIMQEKLAFYY